MELDTAARNAACDAIVDLVDTGGAGIINFYSGSSPGTGVAATGTLLAQCPFGATAFGAAAAGVATANAITTDAVPTANGTIGYARILDGGVTDPTDVVWDATCGTSGSGADIILDTLTVSTASPVAVSAMTFTVPA